MADTISLHTLDRAFHGAVAGKSFVASGADYRKEQNSGSVLQRIVNWIADKVSCGRYSTNTGKEIQAKSEKLTQSIVDVAHAILMTKQDHAENEPVQSFPFSVGQEIFYVDLSDGQDRIFISHNRDSIELQYTLPELKAAMLKEYLARLRNAKEEISFFGFDLRDTDLSGLDLRDCNFVGCDLRGANLTGCNLCGAQFQGVNASGAKFVQADVTRANFTEAMLEKADFTLAWMGEADFTQAKLMGAELTQARATRAIFTKADLTGAKGDAFVARFANFTEADFTKVEFRYVEFRNALFRKAIFTRALIDRDSLIRDELSELQRKNVVATREEYAAVGIQSWWRGYTTKNRKEKDSDVPVLMDSEGIPLGKTIEDRLYRLPKDGRIKWRKLPPLVSTGELGGFKRLTRRDADLVGLELHTELPFPLSPAILKYLKNKQIEHIVPNQRIYVPKKHIAQPLSVAPNLGSDLMKLLSARKYKFELLHFHGLAKNLDSCHAKKIAHRDIKPANMAFHNGQIKLFDLDSMGEIGSFKDRYGTRSMQPKELAKLDQNKGNNAIKKDQYNFFMSMMRCAYKEKPVCGRFSYMEILYFVEGNNFNPALKEELIRFLDKPKKYNLSRPLSDYFMP